MTVLQTAAIFLVAVLGELTGAYAVWRWRRAGGPAWLVPAALGALFLYTLVQTYQPETRFGRLYAAYGGIFLLGAMVWGWLVDGPRPDLFDMMGAAVVLVGISLILWGRDLFA